MRRLALLWVLLVGAASPRAGRAQEDFRQREPEPAAAPRPAPKLTRAPKVKRPVEPVYPPAALAAGREGSVALQIDIDAAGRVAAVAVPAPAGHGFDEAAREAALAMEFEPAEVDGKPSPVRIEYVTHFRLKKAPAETPAPGQDGATAGRAPGLAPVGPAPGPPPTIMIRGRVREKGTRDPLAAADVVATMAKPGEDPGEATTTTDDAGRFELRVPAGGRVHLVISAAEHEPCVRDLDVPAPGGAAIEVVCLVASRQGPRYTTIVRAPRAAEEVTRHSLDQQELQTVPGTFGDPLRVIQNLPGVARSPYGLGLLIIRGSSPQDTGVYVDGHRVPLLYHFLGGPSVLTPDLIDRIDFFPGGFGVRYGRATAGVVDVATRTDPVTRVHGSADVDFIDSSVHLEGPLGGGASGELAARRSYIDALLPFVIPERQGSTTAVVTPVYWDYQARVGRSLGKAGRVSLFAFGSDDSLKVLTSSPMQGEIELGTRIAFHRVIATWRASAGAWTSTLSPSYGYDLFNFRAAGVGGEAWAHVLGLREDLARPVAPWLKFAAGLDAEVRFDHLAFSVPMPPMRRTYGRATRTINDIDRGLVDVGGGAYVEAMIDASACLRLVPGLRADWFHLNGEDRASLDPRVVLRWQRTPAQALKAGAGIFHQAPQAFQLDAEFGNPRLPLLWSDQYHAGIEQAVTRAISLDATLYFLRRHALPIGSSRQDASGRLERYASLGRGRGYGLEVHLRHAVTERFYGWISYTLARSEAVLEVPTPGRPAPAAAPTEFDQTHNFVLVASRRFGRWELGTRFRLVSGVPETPVGGSTYDADYNNYQPIEGPPHSTRRQTFHQLDVRAERTFVFDAWRLSAYVDVQNVYNAENPEATLHDYRYLEQAPVRGLPILPIVGVRGRF